MQSRLGRVVAAIAMLGIGVVCSVARPAYAATECRGTLIQTINDDVVVPSGAFCYLNGALVRGSITVQPGGNLDAKFSTIQNDVIAQNPYGMGFVAVTIGEDLIVNRTQGGGGYFMCGSEVKGSTAIRYSSPGNWWAIGDPQVCAQQGGGNTFGESVLFLANRNRIVFDNNVVRDTVTATDNTGGGEVLFNSIGEDLIVRRNTPCFIVRTNAVRGATAVDACTE